MARILDWDDSWLIVTVAAMAIVAHLNDYDPPEPPQAAEQTAKQAFLGTVYSRTFYNNVERVKEAYFPDQVSCQKFVASNMEQTRGFLDFNKWDSGRCYATGSEGIQDPQVATIFNRSVLGTFDLEQNIKVRYFNSSESCATYIGDYIDQMAGVLDVNTWDTASCHSTLTGQKTSYAENHFRGGVTVTKSNVTSSPPVSDADKKPYIGTTYLRTMFDNVEREKVTYHQSEKACEQYVSDFLKESENTFDVNGFDSAVCLPKSGDGKTVEVSNSFSGGLRVSVTP